MSQIFPKQNSHTRNKESVRNSFEENKQVLPFVSWYYPSNPNLFTLIKEYLTVCSTVQDWNPQPASLEQLLCSSKEALEVPSI